MGRWKIGVVNKIGIMEGWNIGIVNQLIPNPAEPEPNGTCCDMDEFLTNPPNPPLSKGGEGGFVKFGANLCTTSFLRD